MKELTYISPKRFYKKFKNPIKNKRSKENKERIMKNQLHNGGSSSAIELLLQKFEERKGI